MALKMDLKGIFILDLYDILLQIATWNANSEQSMNGSRDARRGSWTHNHSTRSFLKK
jgi:hypothetical protein